MSVDGLIARIEEARSNHQDSRNSMGTARDAATSVLASGIFQELKYKVPQSLPGTTSGSTSRFNLTFRDRSGHPNPTSHAYLNRTSPAANNWKGLRLDYGPNAATGGTTNWHWNRNGAAQAFPSTPDHAVAKPGEAAFGRAMRVAKPLGRAAWIAGAAVDTVSLGSEIYESSQTGNWDNTVVEGSRIAGGWGGAFVGAKLFGMGGAAIGTAICPGPGTAIGGAIGGLIGGALGYFGGSWAGEQAGEEVTS